MTKPNILFSITLFFFSLISETVFSSSRPNKHAEAMPSAKAGPPPLGSHVFSSQDLEALDSPPAEPAVARTIPDTGVLFDIEHGRHTLAGAPVPACEADNVFQVLATMQTGEIGANWLGLAELNARHLAQNGQFNVRDAAGRSPLFYARVRTAAFDMVNNYAVDPNIQDHRAYTALDYFIVFYAMGTFVEQSIIYGPLIAMLAERPEVRVSGDTLFRAINWFLPSEIIASLRRRTLEDAEATLAVTAVEPGGGDGPATRRATPARTYMPVTGGAGSGFRL